MPLSRYGLCDALMTAARSKPRVAMSSGAAGVGRTPPRKTSPPADATPAASAASSISPLSRVSRITSTRGVSVPDCSVAARPSFTARSAVSSSPATPRTPSVPNSLRAMVPRRPLALGELRALAGLLEAGLLALLHACVTREEAALLELGAQVGIGLEQRLGDPVAQGACLRADAAAVHAGHDVHALLVADRLERLADVALQGRAREELVERLAVDRVGAGARLEDHASDRGLALARGAVARAGGKVDGRGGDRRVLDEILVDRLARALLVVGVLVVLRAALLGTLEDQVDLQVGPGDRRLDARGLLDELVLDVLDVGGGLLGAGLLGGGLLGDRLRGRRLLGGRRGLRIVRLRLL